MVDSQIFTKWNFSYLNEKPCDVNSVMMVAHFPKSLTSTGLEIGINDKLSSIDKQFISSLYP
jgi:hypothetical protein